MNRIIVMAKNEVGTIADISRVLADKGLNIETISAEALGDKGVVTLTTNDCDDALRALTDAGFKTVRRRSARPETPGRAWSPRKGRREVQGRGREPAESAHRRPSGRLHHRSPGRRRPSPRGGAGRQGNPRVGPEGEGPRTVPQGSLRSRLRMACVRSDLVPQHPVHPEYRRCFSGAHRGAGARGPPTPEQLRAAAPPSRRARARRPCRTRPQAR